MTPLRYPHQHATPASIDIRRRIVAKLGRDKPVTFQSMKDFKRPNGRVTTREKGEAT